MVARNSPLRNFFQKGSSNQVAKSFLNSTIVIPPMDFTNVLGKLAKFLSNIDITVYMWSCSSNVLHGVPEGGKKQKKLLGYDTYIF